MEDVFITQTGDFVLVCRVRNGRTSISVAVGGDDLPFGRGLTMELAPHEATRLGQLLNQSPSNVEGR